MKINLRSSLATALALVAMQFSPMAYSLTQEECQLRRDSLDQSLAIYKANVQITIANAFRTNSRYARATQIVLNKQVARFVLIKNQEFAAICPDFVPQ